MELGLGLGTRVGMSLVVGFADGPAEGTTDGVCEGHPQMVANVGTRIVGQFGGEDVLVDSS